MNVDRRFCAPWGTLGVGDCRTYPIREGRTVTQEMRRLHKVFHRWKYRNVNTVMRRISTRRVGPNIVVTRVA